MLSGSFFILSVDRDKQIAAFHKITQFYDTRKFWTNLLLFACLKAYVHSSLPADVTLRFGY